MKTNHGNNQSNNQSRRSRKANKKHFARQPRHRNHAVLAKRTIINQSFAEPGLKTHMSQSPSTNKSAADSRFGLKSLSLKKLWQSKGAKKDNDKIKNKDENKQENEHENKQETNREVVWEISQPPNRQLAAVVANQEQNTAQTGNESAVKDNQQTDQVGLEFIGEIIPHGKSRIPVIVIGRKDNIGDESPNPIEANDSNKSPDKPKYKTLNKSLNRTSHGKSNDGSRLDHWSKSPRMTGVVAAILLFAMLAVAIIPTSLNVRAEEQTELASLNPSMQLAKEYIYAGSRMLAIEDYGIAGSSQPTPTPTATPAATPTPETPTPTPTPATPTPTPTPAPATPSIASVTANANPTCLDIVLNGVSGADSYNVKILNSGATINVTSLSFPWCGLSPATYYEYQAQAVNQYGTSGWSATVGGTTANSPPPPTPTPTPIPNIPSNQYYQIVAQHSGKCADVSGVSYNDGAPVHQWDCGNNSPGNQLWRFERIGDDYQIIAYHSGKCLDVIGGHGALQDGIGIQQYTCIGASQPNQLWRIVEVGSNQYQIISKNSEKCLDVPGADQNNGIGLHQWACGNSGQPNQTWSLSLQPTPTPTPEPTPTPCTPNLDEVYMCEAVFGRIYNYETCSCGW